MKFFLGVVMLVGLVLGAEGRNLDDGHVRHKRGVALDNKFMVGMAQPDSDPPCCAQCVDHFKSCAIFAILNLCKFEGWIQTGCNRSCKKCTLPADCECAPPEIPPVFDVLFSNKGNKKKDSEKSTKPPKQTTAAPKKTTTVPTTTTTKATTTTPRPTTKATTVTTTRPDCKNKHKSCERWSQFGECEKNPGYMLYKCRHSCKAC